jgi:hypothetical protein
MRGGSAKSRDGNGRGGKRENKCFERNHNACSVVSKVGYLLCK